MHPLPGTAQRSPSDRVPGVIHAASATTRSECTAGKFASSHNLTLTSFSLGIQSGSGDSLAGQPPRSNWGRCIQRSSSGHIWVRNTGERPNTPHGPRSTHKPAEMAQGILPLAAGFGDPQPCVSWAHPTAVGGT